MKIVDLFTWIKKKLNITTLGFHYSQARPFEFLYPSKKQFQLAYDHCEGTIYDGIAFPDDDVNNTECILQSYNSDSVYLTLTVLNRYVMVPSLKKKDYQTLLCLFTLLHEIGHYLHFLNFKSEKEYVAFRNIYKQELKKIDFDRRTLSEEERLKCEKQYWDLPGEKEANSFAQQVFLPMIIEYWEESGVQYKKYLRKVRINDSLDLINK